MKIFSIKNEKLNFFNRPIYCESANEALTYVQNILMSDADRALIGLKSDLALYELGDIDFVSGIICPSVNIHDVDYKEGFTTPIFICSLEDIFDSIPEDKLKPAFNTDHYYKLLAEIEGLKEKLHNSACHFEKHTHNKKGDVII